MKQIPSRSLLIFGGLILVLSSVVFFVNYFFYGYPGNNYFPHGVILLALILILFNSGLILYFKKGSKVILMGRELLYLFAVMSVVAIATDAVQLTPFPPIDKAIVTLETHLHLSIEKTLLWTSKHPQIKYLLSLIYDSLPYQMSILPLFVIATSRFHLLREYYFFLLCTTLIGFGFYYFFPTTAPASIINSPLFSEAQRDTGLKFWQIHHYIKPTTNEGGLIALPSFHVIWGMLCINLIREWPALLTLLLVNNFLLIAACILLGWHYYIDILGGFIVLLLSYYLYHCIYSPHFLNLGEKSDLGGD